MAKPGRPRKERPKKKKRTTAKRKRVHGAERYRLYRKKTNPKDDKCTTYVPCSSDAKGRIPDSVVHRYHREIGFVKLNEDGTAPYVDERMRKVLNRVRNVTYNPNSTKERVTSQNNFECFMLMEHDGDPYSQFLKKAKPTSRRTITLQKLLPLQKLPRMTLQNPSPCRSSPNRVHGRISKWLDREER